MPCSPEKRSAAKRTAREQRRRSEEQMAWPCGRLRKALSQGCKISSQVSKKELCLSFGAHSTEVYHLGTCVKGCDTCPLSYHIGSPETRPVSSNGNTILYFPLAANRYWVQPDETPGIPKEILANFRPYARAAAACRALMSSFFIFSIARITL